MKNLFNYAAMGGGFAGAVHYGYESLKDMGMLQPGATAVTDLPLAAIGMMLLCTGLFYFGYARATGPRPPRP